MRGEPAGARTTRLRRLLLAGTPCIVPVGIWGTLSPPGAAQSVPMLRLIPLLVLTGFLQGPATDAHAQASALEPPFCLDLTLGEWLGEREIGSDTLLFAPPPRVLLDTVPGVGSHGAFLAREAPGSLPSVHDFGFWSWTDGDTLLLEFTTGFAGSALRLRREGSGFSGSASTHTDVLRQPQFVARVDAVVVDCAAPPRYTMADQRPLLTAIPLAGGDSLRLGSELSQIPGVVPGTPMYGRVDVPLGGPFSEALSAELFAGLSGRVNAIWVKLPATTDLDAWVRDLVRQYGEPTSSYYDLGTYSESVIRWSNRVSNFTLRRSRGRDGVWNVTLMVGLHRGRR